MKFNSYENKFIYTFLFILLLVPFVSARERMNFNVDINSWCSEDNTSSKFNLTLNGNERDLDIDDEATYIRNDLSNSWNGSVTLRFDSNTTASDFCSGDMESLVSNLTNVCQTKTEELADARKFLEDGKADCETKLTTCNTEKTDLKTKSDSYDSMLGNYNNCYSQLTNQTSLLTDCQNQQDNLLWYLIGACLLGGLIGYFGKERIKKIRIGKADSVESRESPHSNLDPNF